MKREAKKARARAREMENSSQPNPPDRLSSSPAPPAAVGASPVVLTTSVFLGMAAQWAFAVRGWLRTDEGARFVAHAASIDRAEASWEI